MIMTKKDKKLYESMIKLYQDAILYDCNLNPIQRDKYIELIKEYELKIKEDEKAKIHNS